MVCPPWSVGCPALPELPGSAEATQEELSRVVASDLHLPDHHDDGNNDDRDDGDDNDYDDRDDDDGACLPPSSVQRLLASTPAPISARHHRWLWRLKLSQAGGDDGEDDGEDDGCV